jgi:hypothetical protein
MSTLEQRGLVRLRYRQRQMLRSDDLRREVHDETELQWWHNRSLHDAYGVVEGLGVELQVAGGVSLAVVSPGRAYDSYGRPLLLDHSLAIGLPSDTADTVLVLRARDPDDGLGSRRRPEPRRHPGVPVVVELCWAQASRLSIRDGVPLACVAATTLRSLSPAVARRLPARIAHDPTTRQLRAIGRLTVADRLAAAAHSRGKNYQAAVAELFESSQACPWPRLSRPLARAHVASGTTQAGDTPWRAWSIELPFGQRARFSVQIPIGFEVRVDTTSAGFVEVPEYFAWLQGPLFAEVGGARTVGLHWDHIEDAAPDGFTFRTSLIAQAALHGLLSGKGSRNPLARAWSDTLGLLRDRGFYVSWLAVEPRCDETAAVSTPWAR